MNIDLTKLITNIEEEIDINIDLEFDESKLQETSIKRLEKVTFSGFVTKLYNNDYQISGCLSGTMILPDDITLEDVEYKFSTQIEEEFSEFNENYDNNLKIIQNRLDISEFLWQNILVEIPLKVVNEKNKNLTLKGDGWRLISEEELEKDLNNNSPFSELKDKFN